MNELIIYSLLFAALTAHAILAGKMYRVVHQDSSLSFKDKNDWKLKALVLPGYFWFQYKKRNQD